MKILDKLKIFLRDRKRGYSDNDLESAKRIMLGPKMFSLGQEVAIIPEEKYGKLFQLSKRELTAFAFYSKRTYVDKDTA